MGDWSLYISWRQFYRLEYLLRDQLIYSFLLFIHSAYGVDLELAKGGPMINPRSFLYCDTAGDVAFRYCQMKGKSLGRVECTLKDNYEVNYSVIIDILYLEGKPVL